MSEIFIDQSKLTVCYNEKPCYDIVIHEDFSALAEASAPFLEGGRKVCIVSDSHVAEHYLDVVKCCLQPKCSAVTTFVFEAGEEQKNLNTVKDLYEHLILNHFERRDLLIALGGGVVGDLTGYTAATYLRGIDFIQVPTSLLAQVDSSVGGKTGVDFDSYKNMVGAFHMPKLVYINTATLKTLSERQYLSGMGEVIKYGIIFDASFFEWIKANQDGIKQLEPSLLRAMIYRSCDNKRKVVEEDPTEQGRRALLNYGHTLGHAIEKLTNFEYLHGECVAVGSILAARIAFSKGLITSDVLADIEQLIADFSFPAIRSYEANDVVLTVKSDKKMSAGQIKFIILDAIGHAYITKDVTDEDMKMVLEAYHAES